VNPLLFVYGSLRRGTGSAMHHRLARAADFVGEGTLPAVLLAWKYPGVLPPTEPHERVRGEVYRLHAPAATLAELDRYEGCGPGDPEPHPYARREAPVALAGGGEVTAWVYWYVGDPSGSQVIPGGDYLNPGAT
jgi:gamma-glutamylcyclotransferase (GGCT)/AIG2-like uncharacterized protein YtfP